MDPASSSSAGRPLSPASTRHEVETEERSLALRVHPSTPTRTGKDSDGDSTLPPLQVAGGDPDGLEPVGEDELDPGSFDLVMPADGDMRRVYMLEKRSEMLFSSRHLQAIFDDPAQLHRFSSFLHQHRPNSIPLLTYYLNALKALRAIQYSNAVLRKLEPLVDSEFAQGFFQAPPTINQELEARADAAFELLAREDLPMYITYVWIQTVTVSIKHRIMGTLPHVSEGLAEVFCLTDPSRPDNPIVFTSEEFNRTTQYGVDYVVGRNCRFLQGPHTNPSSVRRIRERLEAGYEHYETFLNYRRDGSPFMNLIMLAPLYDSRGRIRYFIGAQVDVSGLAKECYGLDALRHLVDEDAQGESESRRSSSSGDEFIQFAEILGPRELEIVRKHGGDMHRSRTQIEKSRHAKKPSSASEVVNGNGTHHAGNWSKPRVVLRDPESPNGQATTNGHETPAPSATAASLAAKHNGRLTGIYEHYLLVRPYPSLRILFTSPSMRVPGILQSPLLDRIGGSERMRDELVQALAQGQGVTAKVKWIAGGESNHIYTNGTSRAPAHLRSQRSGHLQHPLEAHLGLDGEDGDSVMEPEPKGRPRWLHCTPLVGSNGKVGVWMIVIVDDDSEVRLRGGKSDRPYHHSSAIKATANGHVHSHSNGPANVNSRAERPRLRARRSSETLPGSPVADEKSKIKSATKVIHNQHALSSLRAPTTQTATGLPGGFFSLDALSRAARTSDASRNTSPIPTSRQQEGRNEAASHPAARSDTPLSWPLPDVSTPTRGRDRHIYVPPVVDERSHSRHSSGDGDEGSICSRGSAFTVRIEED